MKGWDKRGWIVAGVFLLCALAFSFSFAQFRRARVTWEDVEDDPRAYYASRGIEFPDWEKNEEMPEDCFAMIGCRVLDRNSNGRSF